MIRYKSNLAYQPKNTLISLREPEQFRKELEYKTRNEFHVLWKCSLLLLLLLFLFHLFHFPSFQNLLFEESDRKSRASGSQGRVFSICMNSLAPISTIFSARWFRNICRRWKTGPFQRRGSAAGDRSKSNSLSAREDCCTFCPFSGATRLIHFLWISNRSAVSLQSTWRCSKGVPFLLLENRKSYKICTRRIDRLRTSWGVLHNGPESPSVI